MDEHDRMCRGCSCHWCAKMGFKHCDEVDPFDGGPYLEADRNEIPLVRDTTRCTLSGTLDGDGDELLIARPDGDNFRLVRCKAKVDAGNVHIDAAAIEALQVQHGDELGVTPAELPAA